MTIAISEDPRPHAAGACPGGCDDIDKLNVRIQQTHDQMVRFETRLDEGNGRMGRIEAAVIANSSKLDLNTAETSEMLQMMRDGKSLFRLANYATAFLKWALVLGTAALVFWAAAKDWPRH